MEIRNIYEKAIQLINSSNTLALSAIDEYGYPKIYAMEKVVSEDLNKIIFITKFCQIFNISLCTSDWRYC